MDTSPEGPYLSHLDDIRGTQDIEVGNEVAVSIRTRVWGPGI